MPLNPASSQVVVLHADNHILALAKPWGMLTQPDESGAPSLLDWGRDWIRAQKGKTDGNVFCGLVHRLDRNVSGVVVLARTSKAAARLSQQWAARKVEKVYLARVSPPPEHPEGLLRHHLVKNARTRRVTVHAAPGAGTREAVTRFVVRGSDADEALLEVRPETGRSHQIRAQLAAHGSPVHGDRKYGSSIEAPRLGLHAWKLTFVHPTLKEPITLEAPPPSHWRFL
jgi:23S rRNA pseudouridine1911/1915/1917 synthase